jgi:hypothetical protein
MNPEKITNHGQTAKVKKLKDLSVGFCTRAEIECDDNGKCYPSDTRREYLSSELEKRCGTFTFFTDWAFDEIPGHSPPIDVLITNVTPSSGDSVPEQTEDTGSPSTDGNDNPSTKYLASLRRIAEIAEIGIPVIAYTAAPLWPWNSLKRPDRSIPSSKRPTITTKTWMPSKKP